MNWQNKLATPNQLENNLKDNKNNMGFIELMRWVHQYQKGCQIVRHNNLRIESIERPITQLLLNLTLSHMKFKNLCLARAKR